MVREEFCCVKFFSIQCRGSFGRSRASFCPAQSLDGEQRIVTCEQPAFKSDF
jgi:hypothetical protein